MKLIDTIVHRWLQIPYTLKSTTRHAKGRHTVVFLHGIGNTRHAWDNVIKKLPDNVKIISMDLLGFGASPQPNWAQYNAKTQARSVQATLLQRGVVGRVTVVGHSLGALVGVELAKRYPLTVKRLILCSPPFYRPENEVRNPIAPDRLLRQAYREAMKDPARFVELATLVKQYNILNPSFAVNEKSIATYMATLESMIINQTSLNDVRRLRIPIHIMRGAVDPLIIPSYYTKLKKNHKNVTVQTVAAAHEVVGLYASALSEYIKGLFSTKK